MIVTVVGTISWSTAVFVAIRHVVGASSQRRLVLRRLPMHSERLRPHVTGLDWFRRRDAAATASVDEHERLALLLDAVGRELRLGSSLHGAVLTALTRHPVNELSWLTEIARDGGPLHDAAASRPKAGSNSAIGNRGVDFVLRILVAASEGADAVHAVESAARTLRATAAIVADSRSAVAHTVASIRVLTWVPVLVATLMALRDESVRGFFLSTTGVLCAGAGVALNWLGRWITARLTEGATRVDSEVPDFIDTIAVHLRAGRPPASAFLHSARTAVGATGEAARGVATALHGGERFVDSLLSHRTNFDLRAQPLIDVLVDTERDGLPPRAIFERLADEAKSQRRRDADQRLRALPVRLTLPLVGCVLPAYVLLTVVPLLVTQLSSVEFGPT